MSQPRLSRCVQSHGTWTSAPISRSVLERGIVYIDGSMVAKLMGEPERDHVNLGSLEGYTSLGVGRKSQFNDMYTLLPVGLTRAT